MKMFILVLALHFIADFNLQIGAKLHKMKQKSWWQEMTKDLPDYDREMYRCDWACAMAVHALMWSAITFAPLIYSARNGWMAAGIFLVNAWFHTIVDNAKANHKCISLIEDQIAHLIQICMTMLFCAMVEAVES